MIRPGRAFSWREDCAAEALPQAGKGTATPADANTMRRRDVMRRLPSGARRTPAVPLSQQEIGARRFAARKREIVERVLPVMEQSLSQDGSHVHLSVEHTLKEASLSRTTFYRYFRDKNELLLALIDPVLEDVRAAATLPLDRGSTPTREELQAELRRNFDIYRPHIPLLNALVEVSSSDSEIRDRFEQGFAEVHETIGRHIARGSVASGIC
jgi:AcrR family transcriptional regulator